MAPDPALLSDLSLALELAHARSAVLDFEFLCGFNNQLLCLLEDTAKQWRSGAAIGDLAMTFKDAFHIARCVEKPFVDHDAADTLMFTHWCNVFSATRATAGPLGKSALHQAVKECNPDRTHWETRRWAFGKDDAAMKVHANFKRKVLTFALDQFYGTVYAWLLAASPEQVVPTWLAAAFKDKVAPPGVEVVTGLLTAIDGMLGIINQLAGWKSQEEGSREALTEALRPYVDLLDASGVGTKHPEFPGNFRDVIRDILRDEAQADSSVG